MARAIISGLKNAGINADIIVGEPLEIQRESLQNELNVETTSSNKDAISGADIVVIAVKPQQLDAIQADLQSSLSNGQTVMSIMAGVKMHTIGLKLDHKKLIRVMPNTPAQIRQGISAWTASKEVDQPTLDFVRDMLQAIGHEIRFSDEKNIDVATALSGSGPGYVLSLIHI